MTAATGLCLLLDVTIAVAVLVLIPGVTIAALLGRTAGAWAAVLGAAALSYFFIQPVRVFSLGKPDEALALAAFLAVSTVVSTLVNNVRRADQAVAAARLREADAQARIEVEAGRAAFFATAGHNLRTPLAALRAAAEALHGVDPSTLGSPDTDTLLHGILGEVDRLELLVGKVLQMSRASVGAAIITPVEDVDLAAVTHEVVGRVRRVGCPSVAWTVDVESAPAGLAVDPLAFEQILLNLLENAARYAPPGTTVSVEGRAGGASYKLSVADQGPGVPAADREHIFKPFHSDRRGPNRGAGLGLAIVSGLMAAHAGTVQLVDGVGATFTLNFPIGPAVPATPGAGHGAITGRAADSGADPVTSGAPR